MAQSAKSSIKRGKPSYFMAILGVTIVLIVFGIIGLMTINARKFIQNTKENIEMHVWINENTPDTAIASLQKYIESQPYAKKVTFKNTETAKKEWIQTGGEDFNEFIENMGLPISIDFTIRNEYVDSSHLDQIKADIATNPIVNDVQYPKAVVTKMVKNFRMIGIILAVVAILMAVLVIILIDNTIRLAMFSNRFLIKTMQMVGATRWFIARPLDQRAVINGAISGVIATLVVYILLWLAENLYEGFRELNDPRMLIFLSIMLILLGIGITLFSTHRSVLKYLKMKLDDLY
jgi:cell division transport system permease protein